ncbi:MAG: tripartite tricarboxylate transporter permease, partial [Anaerotignum sp.]|nr:tripartite tricarboxylate transporter permease [Anaerotignum sp.]
MHFQCHDIILFTQTFLILLLGVLGGIVIGALPGLTSTMGVALLLPITYGMEATVGIVMLLGIYCGSVYGGSISAILLNTPG